MVCVTYMELKSSSISAAVEGVQMCNRKVNGISLAWCSLHVKVT